MGVILSGDPLVVYDDYPWRDETRRRGDAETRRKVFIDRRDLEVSPRVVTETAIVCGDCSGDEPLPRKTYLTGDGRCDNCGGDSFLLAALVLRRHLGRQSV